MTVCFSKKDYQKRNNRQREKKVSAATSATIMLLTSAVTAMATKMVTINGCYKTLDTIYKIIGIGYKSTFARNLNKKPHFEK